jgi:hypothetical protein
MRIKSKTENDMKSNMPKPNPCPLHRKPNHPLSILGFARRISRLVHPTILRTILGGALLVQAHSASAALSFARGTPTTVGPVRFSSSPDSVTITAALTGPGTITSALAIPANRIQYDVINSDQGALSTWTLFYDPSVGPSIIGAFTPLGYLNSAGTIVPQGGSAYTTLFNAGYGIYTYNTGAPWSIDYEPDHITFTGTITPIGLPANDGAGYLNPTPYLSSFAILYSPDLANGLVPATAKSGTATFNGLVYGPLRGNPCLSIHGTNIVVETCSNCVPVTFSATAVDNCCSNVVLNYTPPSGTCFPLNSVNTIQAVAQDSCGNKATNYFTVTVNPGPNCLPTNCISITTSNIVAYTCNPCTPVSFKVTATDNCCASPVTLVFNPPETTCFPQNSTTPVQVIGYDQCGHAATNSFTVTILPGPTCPTNCISFQSSNIVAFTCSNCTTVPFNTTVSDPCCPNVSLFYNPPSNTCFAVNSMTPVQIVAVDACGNVATNYITVTVLPGPNCHPTNCITIYSSNIVAYTCSNCITVPFSATAVDTCCPGAPPTLTYSLPATYCFPQNSTTPVQVVAQDQCGNRATNTFTVTVLPGPNCGPTNCISINASNIVAYTCNPCTPVPFTATATDTCCTGAPLTLVYNFPAGYCFPLNSISTVQVTAFDQCGNATTKTFTVTVLPGSNCAGTPGLTLSGSPNSGTGLMVSWPGTNAQLLESSDLIHWSPIPGATNSPYMVPKSSPAGFFRLRYN